jgi:hypothetical protein
LDSADEDFGRSGQKKSTARPARDKKLSQDIRIGLRLAVYWSDDDKYYEGTVTQQRESVRLPGMGRRGNKSQDFERHCLKASTRKKCTRLTSENRVSFVCVVAGRK